MDNNEERIISLVLVELKRKPRGAAPISVMEDGENLAGVCCGIELDRKDLDLPHNDLYLRYFGPAVIPMVNHLKEAEKTSA